MDLVKKTDKEIQKLLISKREDLRDFRFGLSGSKKKNLKSGKTIRADIARILTFINSR